MLFSVLSVSLWFNWGAVTVIVGIHHRATEHTEKTLFNIRTQRDAKDPKDSTLSAP